MEGNVSWVVGLSMSFHVKIKDDSIIQTEMTPGEFL